MPQRKFRGLFAFALTAAFAVSGPAEEGMWTFDNPPLKQLREQYNFTPSREWLDHVRLSCVRLNDGGSGSFVSPHGLLLTNHHVALGQLQKNSTPQRDYLKTGFYAARPEDEMKSPDLEVNVLISMEDVTARVMEAVKGGAPEQEFARRRAAIAAIERESQQKTGLRSDVVPLYQGGEYWLYRYKKYTDVRIVFAPERQIAFFGGDSDNFTYPRYDLDMALYRVYENGKPLDTPRYLKWNPKGAAAGELVFVSGHPGNTERLDTRAQMVSQHDPGLPTLIRFLRSRLGTLRKYAAESPEHSRQALDQIFGLENSLKSLEGEYTGLSDPAAMEKKRTEEQDFRARVMANPQAKETFGDPWEDMAAAVRLRDSRIKENYFRLTGSELASFARNIVQYVAEVKKPDGERLPGYHEAQLESLRFQLASPAPIYADLEIAMIAGSLETNIAELGAGDPALRLMLAGRTPRQAAEELVRGSRLADPKLRQQLLEGGEAAVAASTDTMIVLARQLDPIRREAIKWQQDKVQSVMQRAGEKIGKARFAAYGKNTYPDATFTLRLSYGQVKGYPMNGTEAPAKTTFFGLYDRAASFDYHEPFDLPQRYLDKRAQLDLATPLNFVTTNDIIGGNSGSPVINRAGELVGLVFDGNIESLVGNYVFDVTKNRTVAVHTAGMTEALRKLYGAEQLLHELLP